MCGGNALIQGIESKLLNQLQRSSKTNLITYKNRFSATQFGFQDKGENWNPQLAVWKGASLISSLPDYEWTSIE